MDREEIRALVREHTVIARPWLTPEIRLHLITPDTPMWRANEKQAEAAGLHDPYWAFCWAGGQALARYLLDQPEVVAGKHVLDIGCGGGVEAIAAAKAGASVLGADIDPIATSALTLNAQLNRVALEHTNENLLGSRGPWDVVLAGDVTYEQDLARDMRAWLFALASRGTLVLLADPQRGFLDTEGFSKLACYDSPADDDEDGTRLIATPIFAVTA